jgi:hypothetical protein
LAETQNRNWRLENFLDSLIGELDEAQDTLALKGFNRKLTYTVNNLALELQLFPVYNGDTVLFSTARPGETGASKISIQLGSITDRQIRETTREPIGKDDVSVDEVENLDPETKKSLKKIGVKSVKDIERMEQKDVDLSKASGARVDYSSLAKAIARSRRDRSRPAVNDFSLEKSDTGLTLSLSGANLDPCGEHEEFPIAMVNRKRAKVMEAGPDRIALSLSSGELQRGSNELTIALDPYSIIRLELKA